MDYSLSDLKAVTNGSSGGIGDLGGGSGAWLLILFFLFAGGNGLGNNGERCATEQQVRSDFDTNMVTTKLDFLTQGLCQNTSAIQMGLVQNADMLGKDIMQSQFATQQGFCNTIKAVDDCCCKTNLNNERNTNAIIQRIDALENAHKDELIRELTSKDNICQTVTQILNAQGRYYPYAGYSPCPCNGQA